MKMREIINLIKIITENAVPNWLPDDLIQELRDYQDYVDYDETFGTERNHWQDRLIKIMHGNEPQLSGSLFRATGCGDDVALSLYQGKETILQPSGPALLSWAKTKKHATNYFSRFSGRENDTQSGVLIAMPVSNLKPIFDYDSGLAGTPQEDGEVLCISEPYTLSPKNVIAVVMCDYDGIIGAAEKIYKRRCKMIK